MDCSSPYAMAGLTELKDRFDVAFGNDPDADRHGVVTPSAGLLNPNHHLAACVSYLFGGGRGSARHAASRLRAAYPDLKIVGTASPRVDMSEPAAERRAVLDAISAVAPDLVLVGLGAPKQELWIHESAAALAPAVLLGVGASIDFLAGNARRAPGWMSAAGLEWLYRLAREPGRLWRRYLVRDPRFLGILLAQLVRARAWTSERPS